MNYFIDEDSEKQRLDVFLVELLPDFSRSKIQSLIKEGKILVNRIISKPSYVLRLGDILSFDKLSIRESIIPQAEDITLDIIWEDENMLVLNKPSGMLTHPTTQEVSGTLVNALLYKYKENLSNIGGEFRRGIVHRLDRNTSGLIMVAKNNETHEFLVQEMREKKFSKKYLAIVKGNVAQDEFEINSPIGRHLTQPHKQCVRDDGKESLTRVKVLERYNEATLLELALITGRTHQIRVHMASIGHPVFNDTLYGFGKIKIKTEEQVLQSYKLEFTRPFTEERISLEIPPDSKIKKVIQALKQSN
jgi:23S rRNA pseudouridine1911/1915/1917 synthase